MSLVLPRELRGRLVRDVGIVDVNPEEDRLIGAASIQPIESAVYHYGGFPLRVLAEFTAFAGPRHLVVIDDEAVVEPEDFLQHSGTDERRCVPSLLLQNPREGMRRGLQDEAAGISHLVNVRVLAGEN